LGGLGAIGWAAESFEFAHLTDLHLQPEMRAAEACGMCLEKVARLRPDFVVTGGDLVFDAAETDWRRAELQYDLLEKTLRPLKMPLHHAIGNHDLYGVATKSRVAASAAHFGKKVFEERMGPRYKSFAHKGWQFVMLDSIGTKANGRDFEGWIDAEQIEWLRGGLAARRPRGRLIVVTHVPLVSSVLQLVADPWKSAETYLVKNAREVLEVLWPYEPRMVLQGHTHIRERVLYRGCEFVTSGAVCGNWWKGAREGHPEGFGVVRVTGEKLEWRYETYGFSADKMGIAEHD
jgi:3',5'-cyclic AMP phosphodiesterase CpdA